MQLMPKAFVVVAVLAVFAAAAKTGADSDCEFCHPDFVAPADASFARFFELKSSIDTSDIKKLIEEVKKDISVAEGYVKETSSILSTEEKKLKEREIAKIKAASEYEKAQSTYERRKGECETEKKECAELVDKHKEERELIKKMKGLLHELAAVGKKKGVVLLEETDGVTARLAAFSNSMSEDSSMTGSTSAQWSEVMTRINMLGSMAPKQRHKEAERIWELLDAILKKLDEEEQSCIAKSKKCDVDLKNMDEERNKLKALAELEKKNFDVQEGKTNEVRETLKKQQKELNDLIAKLKRLLEILKRIEGGGETGGGDVCDKSSQSYDKDKCEEKKENDKFCDPKSSEYNAEKCKERVCKFGSATFDKTRCDEFTDEEKKCDRKSSSYDAKKCEEYTCDKTKMTYNKLKCDTSKDDQVCDRKSDKYNADKCKDIEEEDKHCNRGASTFDETKCKDAVCDKSKQSYDAEKCKDFEDKEKVCNKSSKDYNKEKCEEEKEEDDDDKKEQVCNKSSKYYSKEKCEKVEETDKICNPLSKTYNQAKCKEEEHKLGLMHSRVCSVCSVPLLRCHVQVCKKGSVSYSEKKCGDITDKEESCDKSHANYNRLDCRNLACDRTKSSYDKKKCEDIKEEEKKCDKSSSKYNAKECEGTRDDDDGHNEDSVCDKKSSSYNENKCKDVEDKEKYCDKSKSTYDAKKCESQVCDKSKVSYDAKKCGDIGKETCEKELATCKKAKAYSPLADEFGSRSSNDALRSLGNDELDFLSEE